MKKYEIEIGATYVAKVSGKLANVRIVNESQYGGWNAINTAARRPEGLEVKNGVLRARTEGV